MKITEKRSRVLLVEDTRDVQFLLVSFLRHAGFAVVAASNGQEALDHFHQSQETGETFDAIILDMQMPVMDGYKAAEHLRASHCVAPILALSANVTDIDRQRGANAGCTDFLSKPLRARELIACVQSLIEDAEAGRPHPYSDPPQPFSRPASLPSPGQDAVITTEADDIAPHLLRMFADRLDARLVALRNALDAGNEAELRHICHQFTGSAATFGFPTLAELVRGVPKLTDATAQHAIIRQIGDQVRGIQRGIPKDSGAAKEIE